MRARSRHAVPPRVGLIPRTREKTPGFRWLGPTRPGQRSGNAALLCRSAARLAVERRVGAGRAVAATEPLRYPPPQSYRQYSDGKPLDSRSRSSIRYQKHISHDTASGRRNRRNLHASNRRLWQPGLRRVAGNNAQCLAIPPHTGRVVATTTAWRERSPTTAASTLGTPRTVAGRCWCFDSPSRLPFLDGRSGRRVRSAMASTVTETALYDGGGARRLVVDSAACTATAQMASTGTAVNSR
jgi:hypothetical protein